VLSDKLVQLPLSAQHTTKDSPNCAAGHLSLGAPDLLTPIKLLRSAEGVALSTNNSHAVESMQVVTAFILWLFVGVTA